MNPTPPWFTVRLVGAAGTDLEWLTARAEQRGLRALLLETLRQIADNLETQPR